MQPTGSNMSRTPQDGTSWVGHERHGTGQAWSRGSAAVSKTDAMQWIWSELRGAPQLVPRQIKQGWKYSCRTRPKVLTVDHLWVPRAVNPRLNGKEGGGAILFPLAFPRFIQRVQTDRRQISSALHQWLIWHILTKGKLARSDRPAINHVRVTSCLPESGQK